MNRNWKTKFLTFAIGQAASLIGSAAVQFALIWWIATQTDSAVMMGLAGLVAFLPMAVLSPVAGILADRYNRKTICIASDLFIGIAAALAALALWRLELPVWTALVILLVRSVGSTFQTPAMQAMIPQFVPAEALLQVGGWNQILSSGAYLLGPALGAALYAAFPLSVVLLTDLAGAVIASALLAAIRIPPAPTVPHEKRHPVQELREGWAVFRADRPLLVLIAVQTLCMLFFLPLSSFYPLMTSSYFAASAWHGSVVEVTYAAGMLLMAALFGSVLKVKRPLRTAYLGLVGIGVITLLCGLLPPQMWAWAVFALLCGLLGACGNLHSIPLIAYLQTTVEPEKMGRAFALLSLLGSLTMPLGLLFGSPVAEAVGVSRWFLIAGVGVTAISLLVLPVWRLVDTESKDMVK